MEGLLPQLRALVERKVLTGFALVTVQGVVGDAVGPLANDLLPLAQQQHGGEPAVTPAALQFLRPFNTTEPVTESVTVAGVKLVVVRQDEGSLLALGRKRDVCLMATQLSTGIVLVVTWGRRVFPQSAVCVVEDLLRGAGMRGAERPAEAHAALRAASPTVAVA